MVDDQQQDRPRHPKSIMLSLIVVFASLHTVLGLIPGIWRSWIIVIEPLEGVILGPIGGFLSALIGSLLSRFIRPRTAIMHFFGIGEPIGAFTSGLVFKGKLKIALIIYTLMLLAYFIHPLGRTLPAWCLWDIYVAYFLITIGAFTGNKISRKTPVKLLFTAIAGIEIDVLWRIFLFIPLEFYKIMGVPEDILPAIWVAGAFETPVESVISIASTVIIGIPLLKAIDKSKLIKYPVT